MSFQLRFGPDAVRVLEDELAFQGHFQVRRLTLQYRGFAGGWVEPVTREVFERGDAVGVLPYEPVSDSLVLVEQFRPGALGDSKSPWMLELVAGIVEPGESDESVVHREAMEEAGCSLSTLESIASFYPSSGACTEHVRLYCGRVTEAGIGGVHGLAEEGEDILVHAVPRQTALELLAANEIPNGHTLIALQWLAIHGDRLRERWLESPQGE
ncbi:MAG: NUDIX domain-containing protein [Pseudomonadota bacterium]